MNKNNTYKLKFRCWNCGHIWEQDIPKGYLVEYSYGVEATMIHSSEEDEWKSVICPNCMTKKDVTKYINDQDNVTRKNIRRGRPGDTEEDD